MKRFIIATGLIILSVFTLFACSSGFRLVPDYNYGQPVDYGEKIHPGLDYGLKVGTPVIACSDGHVVLIIANHH